MAKSKVVPEPARLAYSPEEVQKLLGLSRSTVYERIWDGTIPSIRIGNRLLIPVRALERLLDRA